MKTPKNKNKGIFGKLIATVTAGATLGLAAYVFLKKEKSNLIKNESLGLNKDVKEGMFV